MGDLGQEVVVIRARRAWWEVDWRGLAHFRDLLWLLVRRDFVSKYKQTILGPAWMVIQPLATTLVFIVIFARVAGISTEQAPPLLFYLCGLLAWNLFSQILSGTGNVLQANVHIFGKVFFPRLIVPLSIAVSALIPFAIQFLTFLGFYLHHALGHGLPVSAWRLALVPVFVFQTMLLGLGGGLLFSALTAVYRDLQHLLGFATQMLMYVTPIIYPLSQLPGRWRWVAMMNPLSMPVEGLKWAFLGGGSLTAGSVAFAWGATLLLLAAGFFAFNVVERSYVDRA